MKKAVCAAIGACALMGTTAGAQLSSELVTNGVSGPVFVTHAGDGSGRVFVLEQSGAIRIIDENGNLLATPYIDLDPVVLSGGERGLLGLAFHPEFSDEGSAGYGKFYVNYSDTTGGDTIIAEYMDADVTDNVASASTARILMEIDQPFSNHNGGWIGFGPEDGYLYISTGDGGSGGDPGNRAARLNTLLGKMLRIDVDTMDTGLEYGIPASNPAWTDAGAFDEIYHYGLRNAWRCSFDRETGDLWIADVGQGSWEEVNHNVGNTGGVFYGWRCREGAHDFTACGETGWVDPQFEYARSGGNCSITGGYVYRGCELGEAYQGMYFYADYCLGQVRTVDPNGGYAGAFEFNANFGVTSFGEDEAGELYYTRSGAVYKIVNNSAPDKDENGIPDACESAACPADLDGSGSLDFGDVSEFLRAFAMGELTVDFDSSGSLDFGDVSAFLGLFAQGCP